MGDTIKDTDSSIDTGIDGDNNAGDSNEDVDVTAFAEIISEKDKKLEELSEEINKLKKANADMLLRISSDKPDTFDFDKAVMGFDTRTIR